MNKDKFEESPNRTVIEMASVTKLKDALIRTELIVPAIPDTDDRVPSWDGEIRLYSSRENFQKDTMLERIPTQVKGTWVKRFSQKRATFQASTSDLRNYLNDGGIIFFLIQIKDFDEYKIYYTSLLPFDLRRLLDEAGEQKTKSIKLDIFPHKHRDGIVRILTDYSTNKKKQGTLLPNIRSIHDLENSQMEIERFEFSVPGTGLKNPEDIFEEMLSHPRYIYAKPTNMDVSFAVDKIHPARIVVHRNNPVKVNGEILYNQVDVIHLPDKKILYKLGNDVTISIENSSLNFNYSFQGTLHEQICEMKLISALMQKQSIVIGAQPLPIDFELNFHGHTLDEATNRLSDLLRIDTALKLLHIKKDLNLGSLTEHELHGLKYLVDGIVDKRPVPLTINGRAGAGALILGNVTIWLCSKEAPNGHGFLIYDFFSTNDLVLAEKGLLPEDGIKISPYVFMDAESFETIDNADLTEIVPSIKKFPYTALYGERIVWLVLELLRLFDKNRNEQIFGVVFQLLDYLQKNESSQAELYQINRLQAEKRRRSLQKDEIQYLMSLKKDGIPQQYQLAANILLESFQEARMIYDALPDSKRKAFDLYPIMNLWPK